MNKTRYKNCHTYRFRRYGSHAFEPADSEHSFLIKKPANKSQVLLKQVFLIIFLNLFLCTTRRLALFPVCIITSDDFCLLYW